MKIRVGIVGNILAGDELGSYIKIVDDEINTGGFLILISTSPEMKGGYDNWVEDYDALESYFEESNWVVDWPPV